MDGLRRERRPYFALEVEEDDAYSKVLKDSARRSRVPSNRVAEARDSLLWFLPGLSCLCAQNSLKVAYEDLEERFSDLEER